MIIQCDFDGTITRKNLSILLRENFAHGGWQKLADETSQSRIEDVPQGITHKVERNHQ